MISTDSDCGATIHGDALLIGEHGVLVRGASGAGKSALTLALVAAAEQRRTFSRLIGDDRVELVARHGRLIARPHSAIAGLIESRGLGILRIPYEPAGVIRLVVDLLDATAAPPRFPPEGSLETQICGVVLPRLWTNAAQSLALEKIFLFFHSLTAK
jgi:HPr kinase/phosphorylase